MTTKETLLHAVSNVVFALPADEFNEVFVWPIGRYRYVCRIGPPRVKLLRAFFQGETLGDMVPFVFGFGPVAHDEVDWTTAGEAVTSPHQEVNQ